MTTNIMNQLRDHEDDEYFFGSKDDDDMDFRLSGHQSGDSVDDEFTGLK